jgi:hypothetical protein
MVPASNRTDIAVEGAWLLATPDFTMPEKVVKSVESRTGIPGHMTMFQQRVRERQSQHPYSNPAHRSPLQVLVVEGFLPRLQVLETISTP